ncbi:helix-turn-helix domain-containing protein [Clostridium sp. YIM B02569]|uniref:winged helix-turn-helix transcriptional regulator n=1 Tax=Clostridium sp. YIM B02569 TaxID=2911967 RepID=UPI001EEEA095|nr:helix-turn-helix domain-containing protein [Clostridium sp. YIM B02569]
MNDERKDKSINTHLQYLLKVIGGKWKLPILCILTKKEVVRFNELKRELNGITNMSLSNCLQELEQYKIVKRIQYLEMPPRVEYSLTENSKKLIPSLKGLSDWAKEQIEINDED